MFKIRSIRFRLIATFLLLVILPLSLVSWFLLQWLNQYYLVRLQDNMNAEASIITEAVADDMLNGRTIEAKALLNNPPSPLRSQARVFLFGNQGDLIAASDSAFAPVLGELLKEPGLEIALSGRVARGIEVSPATKIPVVYVAQPVIGSGRVIGAVHLSYSLADIMQAETWLRVTLTGAVLIVIGVATLVGFLLVRSITRPLAQLSLVAADIAGGHFDQRVSETVPAEMKPLSQSFNRMAEALENAERSRQVTFANIAHDIRTPLGSIQAAAEALSEGAIEQTALRDLLLDGLIEHTRYLGRLTQDFLRLAAFEGGGLVLHKTPIDIGAVIRQAVNGVELRAQKDQIEIAVDLPQALPQTWADSDRVLEIMFNLLDNAITYTSQGGQIRVWVEVDNTRGVEWVHVSDTGPCISEMILSNLFDRYWRGDYRRSNDGVNMGLGLNIVKELVRAHGGAILVSNLSDGPDFHFSLPVFQIPLDTQRIVNERT